MDHEAKKARATEIINQAFAALPDSGEEIAAFFQVRDIKGNHRAAECPMAVYLKGELAKGGLPGLQVSVSPMVVVVTSIEPNPVNEWATLTFELAWGRNCSCGCSDGYPDLPRKVTEFVELHDGGRFPHIDTTRRDAEDNLASVAA